MSILKITLADLNGNDYLGSAEGEKLEQELANIVWIPKGVVPAKEPLAKANLTVDQARIMFELNLKYMIGLHDLKKLDASITVADLQSVAIIKMLCVKAGLVSTSFAPTEHHVDYTEVISEDLLDHATRDAKDKDYNADLTKLAQKYSIIFNAAVTTVPDIDGDAFVMVRKYFTDMVCIVACVFRQRGHHYTTGLHELYERLWKKCRYEVAQLPCKYVCFATFGLHAVYPDILDAYWKAAKDDARCNGALIKRYESAPAGAAGPYVIDQGLLDLKLIAPGVENAFPEAAKELREKILAMKENRWHGSVNARYYGAKRFAIDEKKLGAIAATIVAALQNFSDDAPLLKSPALKRIAANAPITGAVMARAVGKIADKVDLGAIVINN